MPLFSFSLIFVADYFDIYAFDFRYFAAFFFSLFHAHDIRAAIAYFRC